MPYRPRHRDSPSPKQLVLVVDDDVTMRLLARETLEQAGFRVEEAADGGAGVAAFERLRPDIVLLDVQMPVLDGFGACAALRKLEGGDHVPVLMMTGLDDSDSINRAYEVGATDFITKPIAWPMLGHRVRYLLRANRAFLDLTQSQARLINAQRIAQLGHWEWHIASDEVQRSDEIYRIVGLDPERFPAAHESFLEIIYPEDRPMVEDALYAAMHRQKPFNLDFRIVRPDGTIRIVHEQGEVHYDGNGKPVRMQGTTQDITERKRAAEQIRQLALYDSLTGLPNRHLFKEQLVHAVARAERTDQVLVMLSLDLDRFKRINDTLGHEVGDLLLKEVASRLARSLRQTDYVTRNHSGAVNHCVARQGGDEFTVLLGDLNQAQEAAKVARRILEALSQPFNLDGNEIVMSASIGIAVYPLDGNDADSLLKNADAAMYYAKEQGKNNYQYYNDKMNTSALQKMTLESNLHKALERAEVQPVLPAQDRRDERLDHRRGGLDPLAPSRARAGLPGGVHSIGRGNRPDHSHRRMGAAQRVRAATRVAAGRPHAGADRGQHLRQTVSPAGHRRDGDACAAGPRRRSALAGNRDHREHRDAKRGGDERYAA